MPAPTSVPRISNPHDALVDPHYLVEARGLSPNETIRLLLDVRDAN